MISGPVPLCGYNLIKHQFIVQIELRELEYGPLTIHSYSFFNSNLERLIRKSKAHGLCDETFGV